MSKTSGRHLVHVSMVLCPRFLLLEMLGEPSLKLVKKTHLDIWLPQLDRGESQF